MLWTWTADARHSMGRLRAHYSYARVTVLQRGAVLAEGPYVEVRDDPRVIEAYLGQTHA